MFQIVYMHSPVMALPPLGTCSTGLSLHLRVGGGPDPEAQSRSESEMEGEIGFSVQKPKVQNHSKHNATNASAIGACIM